MKFLDALFRLHLTLMIVIAIGQIGFAQDTIDLENNESAMPELENPARWSHQATVSIPRPSIRISAERPEELVEVILGPDVFTIAKPDLSDLRLFDSSGNSIPFALRYLRSQQVEQAVSASEFNRDEPKHGVHEIALDLLQNDLEHNAIRVITTGDNFRRRIELDGGTDGTNWRRITAGNLIRFSEGDKKFEIDRLEYPDTRFRFVRVRVSPDTNPSAANPTLDEFEFHEVSVLRQVDLPGERVTMRAKIGQREPRRSSGAPSSAWLFDLGGEKVPCDQVEIDVVDRQFARDVTLQAELPYGPMGKLVFSPVFGTYGTTWQRKAGDPAIPMVASFTEVQTGRLRLMVADYRNAPLSIRAARFSAAARQIVFAAPTIPGTEVRLYVGNPEADLPNFDFARNLPDQLSTNPARGQLLPLENNPMFVPPPKPFLERFPWLIYIVLSAVIATLAIVIASLAKTAIRLHDTALEKDISGMPPNPESQLL